MLAATTVLILLTLLVATDDVEPEDRDQPAAPDPAEALPARPSRWKLCPFRS